MVPGSVFDTGGAIDREEIYQLIKFIIQNHDYQPNPLNYVEHLSLWTRTPFSHQNFAKQNHCTAFWGGFFVLFTYPCLTILPIEPWLHIF